MIKNKINYSQRKYVIGSIFILVSVILLIKLFIIQIVDDSYKQSSDNTTLRYITQYPSRGKVYDRDGRLLIYNDAVYDLMIIPSQAKNIDTASFCKLLNISNNTYNTCLKKAKKYSMVTPSIFLSQITKDEYGHIAEMLYHYPGFYFQTRSVRQYPLPIAAHTLGNIGEVTKGEMDKDSYYKLGDYIGKSGIEKYYEKELRGEKGMKILVVDVHNREKERFMDGEYDTAPIHGTDIILGLDADLQAYGEYLMAGKTGSIVAIEPSTGQILAMVSSPSYDPNELVGRKRGTRYSELLNDPDKPLINRAISGVYPPGSTFKMVNGLIALQSGVMTAYTAYPCSGPESTPIKCTHFHSSPVKLYDAIENSCNPYFWRAFQDMMSAPRFKNPKEAYMFWYNHVTSFGLGRSFASDIPFTVSGNIPTKEFYDKTYNGSWNAMTIRSLSIGQGEILVTPLQLANVAAAIGNEGYYYEPHYIKSFANTDKSIDSSFLEKHIIDINKRHFKDVKKGMRSVFEGDHGTARFSKIDSITVAGKTGTAENPHGKDHSIFMAFAPVDNPQIAIAVVVENAGFGSTWAAPIASLMIEKYIRGYVKRPNVEKRVLTLNNDEQ
ncbi:MAG: penicillin-binding protein 2 [Bacteroidales bacterium]|nr:penicillin-binding protein 2 [Bacteroidales bacterium]